MLLLTDLEPDDIFAIFILYMKKYDINTIMIGERSLDIITPLINECLKCLLDDKIINELPKIITKKEELEEVLEKENKIICLKPPRELVLMMDKLKDKDI